MKLSLDQSLNEEIVVTRSLLSLRSSNVGKHIDSLLIQILRSGITLQITYHNRLIKTISNEKQYINYIKSLNAPKDNTRYTVSLPHID